MLGLSTETFEWAGSSILSTSGPLQSLFLSPSAAPLGALGLARPRSRQALEPSDVLRTLPVAKNDPPADRRRGGQKAEKTHSKRFHGAGAGDAVRLSVTFEFESLLEVIIQLMSDMWRTHG